MGFIDSIPWVIPRNPGLVQPCVLTHCTNKLIQIAPIHPARIGGASCQAPSSRSGMVGGDRSGLCSESAPPQRQASARPHSGRSGALPRRTHQRYLQRLSHTLPHTTPAGSHYAKRLQHCGRWINRKVASYRPTAAYEKSGSTNDSFGSVARGTASGRVPTLYVQSHRHCRPHLRRAPHANCALRDAKLASPRFCIA